MRTVELTWLSLKIGMIFLAGIVSMAILGVFIGKNSALFSGFKTYRIFVADAEGLAESSFVSISGKKVGIVSQLSIAQREALTGVKVDVRIEDEFANLITDKSVASIKAIGILGDKYVDISLSQLPGQPLEEGSYLHYKRKDGLVEITESATSVMKSLDQLLQKINNGEGTVGALIGSKDLTTQVIKIVNDLETVVQKTARGNGLVGKLVQDDKLAQSFTGVVENLQDILTKVKEGNGTLGKLVKDESLYNDMSQTALQLNTTFQRLDKGEGTAGKLLKDEQLYRNLNSTLISLDSLLKDLKENPSKYINVRIF